MKIKKLPLLAALSLCLTSYVAQATMPPMPELPSAPEQIDEANITPVLLLDFLSENWNPEFSFMQGDAYILGMPNPQPENKRLFIKSTADESKIWAIVEKTIYVPGPVPMSGEGVTSTDSHDPKSLEEVAFTYPMKNYRALLLNASEYLHLLDLVQSLPKEWSTLSDNGICDISDQVITFQDQTHRIIGSCGNMDNLPLPEMQMLADKLKKLQNLTETTGQLVFPAAASLTSKDEELNSDEKGDYNYVGNWTAGGVCTASLIAPSWALTAKHCVGSKVRNGSTKPTLRFGMAPLRGKNVKKAKKEGRILVSRKGTDVFLFPSRDIALVKLSKPIKQITPVKLLSSPVTRSMPQVRMTVLGKLNGTSIHKKRPVKASRAHGSLYHSILKDEKSRPGKAGYSGGPWVIEDEKLGHVQIGVNHGGGRGASVGGKVSKWIEEKLLKYSGEAATFVTKDQLKVYTRKR